METLINAYSGCIESKYNGAFVERYIYSDNGLIKENTKDKYVDICRKNASPLQLVEKAKELKNTLAKDPEINTNVWCVFDKDQFDKGSNPFDKAIELAKENEINCAYSNRQIEVWFLLHLEKFHNKCSADTLINKLNEKLEDKIYTKYSKGDSEIFEKAFIPNTSIAIANAKDEYNWFIKNKGKRPISEWASSTNMFKLLEDLGI